MSHPLSPAQLDQLKQYPTPTICNAIEMFDVRRRSEGFMLPGIRCHFPELGVMVGYAATAAFRFWEPVGEGPTVDMEAYYQHILAQPEPRILVAQNLDDPPVGALFGEVNASVHQALGCVGHLTNGGLRDLDEVREFGFHFFSGCIQVSHAYVHMESFGEPVEVGGLTVQPSDLLHADQHGVSHIPHKIAPELAEACAAMEELERPLIELARSAEFTPERYTQARAEFGRRFEEASQRFQR